MDLLRSTIESIFYRFPLNDMAEVILDRSKEDSLQEYIVEIVTHNNPEFTFSEISLLGRMLDDSWLTDKEFGFSNKNATQLDRLPLLLNKFSAATLICSNYKYPKVQFNQLLRWRMLTMLLGEDLFTLPFLSRLDLSRNLERQDFCWPNILGHDNFRLNIVLNEALSDTHSHINAAIDVFDFNWICLMNSPEFIQLDSSKTKFMFSGATLEYDLVRHFSEINYSLSQWTYIAASIRLMLFSKIEGIETPFTPDFIRTIIQDPVELSSCTSLINDEIERNSNAALKLNLNTVSNGQSAFDYAIKSDTLINSGRSSSPTTPYLLHVGERKLIYDWFKGYYGNKDDYRSLSAYVILYLLIKSKVRREYIQTNSLVGFRNFQIYQSRKDNFLKINDRIKKSFYGEIAYRYSVQTSVGLERNNYIEARLTPDGIQQFRSTNFSASIFKNGTDYNNSILNQISIVAHLIKSADSESPDVSLYRHSSIRERYWHQIKIVVAEFLKNNPTQYPDVTGIDAASNELLCRPEVFAPMFRYARHCGISRFTYHAGEDFYDIIDGLRTIDEAIDFMGYTIGDRIGHGLALGSDTTSYYTQKHNILLIPRQFLLDNVVWMKYKAKKCRIRLSEDTELFIERHYNELSRELGFFAISPSMYEYYCSMKFRGDLIDAENFGIHDSISDDIRYSTCSYEYHRIQTIHPLEDLHRHYEMNPECRKRGAEPIAANLPESYAQDVFMLQEEMLKKIERQGIVIETNPSSNLKIGRFNRYDEHPITLFNSVTNDSDHHAIVVSINTDDKGVFSTSLENEYSLIAIALKKQKDNHGNRLYSEGQIEDYLRRIARYGNISRF